MVGQDNDCAVEFDVVKAFMGYTGTRKQNKTKQNLPMACLGQNDIVVGKESGGKASERLGPNLDICPAGPSPLGNYF